MAVELHMEGPKFSQSFLNGKNITILSDCGRIYIRQLLMDMPDFETLKIFVTCISRIFSSHYQMYISVHFFLPIIISILLYLSFPLSDEYISLRQFYGYN